MPKSAITEKIDVMEIARKYCPVCSGIIILAKNKK
jgi:hypothetical protein